MGFRIRYQLSIDYLPPGIGAMGGYPNAAGAQLGIAPAASAQTLAFFNTASNLSLAGGGTSFPGGNGLVAGDITTLLTAMTTDLSTQMNAQIGRISQFPNGGT
jgi:hypothetical protein